MKVILLEDVRKQGKKGEVIDVSDGYGNNYLIKNGLAKLADSSALNALNAQKKAQKKVEAEELAEATVVNIKTKTGEDGRLFGTIPSKQIADELKKQFDIKVDRRKINMENNLSSLGFHNVEIKLHTDVTANIRVQVEEQ